MSIAWGSLLLLVVLLPGVLFSVGLYIPEKFTRDASERSALGQLAGVLLVALGVNGLLYTSGPLYCGRHMLGMQPPCIDLRLFFAAISLERSDVATVSRIAANVEENRGWILLYIFASAGLGVSLGWSVGAGVVRGKFRFLTQHRWVYDLSLGDQLTTAWVLTNIREGDRVLMYRGFTVAFHLKRDGTFSYVVLELVRRGYLLLTEDGPSSSKHGSWEMMGEAVRQAERTEPRRHRRFVKSMFAIEGEDIANLVFDRYAVGFNMAMRDKKLLRTMEEQTTKFFALRKDHTQGTEPSPARPDQKL